MDNSVHKYPSGHQVIPATLDHVEHIATHMRYHDVLEVEAHNFTPHAALECALRLDIETYTIVDHNDVPYGMFGCGAGHEGFYIWMLGTNDVKKYRRIFIKHSRAWVWGFVGIYEKVYNYVHTENKLAMRWLRWCGAEFEEPILINDQPFSKFTINKENVCVYS